MQNFFLNIKFIKFVVSIVVTSFKPVILDILQFVTHSLFTLVLKIIINKIFYLVQITEFTVLDYNSC